MPITLKEHSKQKTELFPMFHGNLCIQKHLQQAGITCPCLNTCHSQVEKMDPLIAYPVSLNSGQQKVSWTHRI